MRDPEDARRLLVALTASGRELVERARRNAERITQETLAPLDEEERETLLGLLKRLR
jgi:DNA-binding MarR family transcriptional regulator